MKFKKDILKSKKAIAIYVSFAVLIASAFGLQDVACSAAEFLQVEVNACMVSE